MGDEESADYDQFARRYAEHAERSSFNAGYDRPGILGLVGDVAGLRVLDLGCAAGALTGALVDRGATVTGVDRSGSLIELAEERHGHRAAFRVADLADPMDFADDEGYDVVVASLVLHYLRDWGPTLTEIHRVLRPGGRFVMSTHHPGEDWHWLDRPNYFVTELVTDLWQVDGEQVEVSFYRRPLSAVFGAIRGVGFVVDELAEPMPAAHVEQAAPEDWLFLTTRPNFLFIRAVKPEGG